MTREEAIERLTEAAKEDIPRFLGLGLDMRVEVKYNSALFREVSNLKRAKYINILLIFSKEGLTEEEEYRLGMIAEVKLGQISEEDIEKEIEGFRTATDEAYAALSSADNKAERVKELTKEAEEEFNKYLEEFNQARSKGNTLQSVAAVLIVVGLLIIFLLATRG